MDKWDFCRLCALRKNNLLRIDGEEGLAIVIQIKKCLHLELSQKSSLPSSICMDCCSKLEYFEQFVDATKNAQDKLDIIFSQNTSGDLPCPKQEEFKVLPRNLDKIYERSFFDIDNARNNKNRFCENQENSSSADGCNIQNKCILSGTVNTLSACFKISFNESKQIQKDAPSNVDTWLCCDCSEVLSTVEDLRRHHETAHKQEAKYMCAYCSELFVLYGSFKLHLKKHTKCDKYNCHSCGKGFITKKLLDSHLLTHSNIRPYVCEECGKRFKQQNTLYVHSRCHLPEEEKNKFPCELCNKRFSSKPNLVTHMRIHAGIKNYTCDQCGKSFIQKGNLDAHFLTHTHDKPHSCDFCSKSFKTILQLRKHGSVHTGEKPHECDVCGKTFREKGTLREHHRIHTGAMPFSCDVCGKSFRFKGILTTHRRQHTGERPYSCTECEHHFTNWPNYNKHMKRRHGINTSRTSRPPDGGVRTTSREGCLNVPANQDFTTDQAEVYQQPTLTPYEYSVYNVNEVQIDALTI